MMTDLEICKRIAEIEGYKVSTGVRQSCGAAYVNMHPNNCYGNYNPLTDKTLCFDLMLKYGVAVKYIDNEPHFVIPRNSSLYPAIGCLTPNKAICLAIIEAHEE